MKKYIGAFILIFGLLSLTVDAQQASLSIDTTSVTVLPGDTLAMNDSLTINFSISNIGSGVYNGFVSVDYQFNNNLFFETDSIGQGQVIFPGNAITYSRSLTISPLRFITGDNIVVIWPTGIAPALTADSIQLHIFILEPSSVSDLENLDTDYKLIYDDQFNFLHLLFADDNKPVYMNVFNMMGQSVFQTKEPVNNIPISDLGFGVYLLHIQTVKGETLNFKFLKK